MKRRQGEGGMAICYRSLNHHCRHIHKEAVIIFFCFEDKEIMEEKGNQMGEEKGPLDLTTLGGHHFLLLFSCSKPRVGSRSHHSRRSSFSSSFWLFHAPRRFAISLEQVQRSRRSIFEEEEEVRRRVCHHRFHQTLLFRRVRKASGERKNPISSDEETASTLFSSALHLCHPLPRHCCASPPPCAKKKSPSTPSSKKVHQVRRRRSRRHFRHQTRVTPQTGSPNPSGPRPSSKVKKKDSYCCYVRIHKEIEKRKLGL